MTYFVICVLALYVSACVIVCEIRKRRDPRFHYARNEDPTGRRYGFVLTRVGRKMKVAKASTVFDEPKTIGIRSHPSMPDPYLPDTVMRWLAPLYWRIPKRAIVHVVLLVCKLLAVVLAVLGPSFNLGHFSSFRTWVLVGFLLGFVSQWFTDTLMTFQIPSRHPFAKTLYRMFRVLTFQPIPEMSPAERRQIERMEQVEEAEERAFEQERMRGVAEVDRSIMGVLDVRNI